MKIKTSFLLILSLLIIQPLFSQTSKDPILLTISDKGITKNEFEKIYHKNNSKEALTETKSLEEYLELFINYKLKVKEAEELMLDTAKSFKTELAGYRKQLSQPYLIDKDENEKLVAQVYERMKKDVRASHILIKMNPDASPEDTLKTFKRVMKIRDLIVKGADFAKMAKDSSEDPSAKENLGDLGYFTALQMVYPFENAVYNLKTGELSQAVRTRFGYHIIKLTDIRSNPGELTAAHIMVKAGSKVGPDELIKAKAKIDSIHKLLKDGGNFEELAKSLSDDPGSARTGGTLPPFGTGRMVPEFEKAAYEIKNKGEFSAPIKTAYGFHIIKLIDRKGIAPFEEIRNDLKAKVSKDSRSELSKITMLNKIKVLYKFQEFPKAKTELLNSTDPTLSEGAWVGSSANNLDKPIFNILDKSYSQKDFVQYVVEHQVPKKETNPKQIMSTMYDQFLEESLIEFRENRLSQEYPEYKALMEEYRDGILLFELTDAKVWSKAVKDTAGLKEFFTKNNNKYMWPERVKADIYSLKSEELSKKIQKLAKKKDREEIEKELNQSDANAVQSKSGVYAKGENEFLDKVKWEKGFVIAEKNSEKTVLIHVKEVTPPSFKNLDESRGIATSDYQVQLEKDWIEALRKKYPVNVNKEVLKGIK